MRLQFLLNFFTSMDLASFALKSNNSGSTLFGGGFKKLKLQPIRNPIAKANKGHLFNFTPTNYISNILYTMLLAKSAKNYLKRLLLHNLPYNILNNPNYIRAWI